MQLKGNGNPEAEVDGTNVGSYDVSVGLSSSKGTSDACLRDLRGIH